MLMPLRGAAAWRCCLLADTLDGPDAAALTRHLPKLVAAINKLHLTPAQQHAIAAHAAVWRSLSAPVDAETTQLQQQMQQLCSQEGSAFSSSKSSSRGLCGGSGSSSESAGACGNQGHGDSTPAGATAVPGITTGSSSSSDRAGLDSAPDRAAFIEAQMRLADRLQVVLKKKHGVVTMACGAFFVGRLSWVQFARLVVLSWPFPVSLEIACKAVGQMVQRQQL